MQALNRIRQLDAFPKINEDFYSRSLSGGVITLISSIAMVLLFLTELKLFLNPVTQSQLIVDTSRGETLKIYVPNLFLPVCHPPSILTQAWLCLGEIKDLAGVYVALDVTFPSLACSIISLDAMDISGEQHLDVKHNIFKKRLDSSGRAVEPPKQENIGGPQIEKPLQKHGGRLEHNETYCGSCFGAEQSDDDCCNSCEEVREAYRRKGWGLTNPDLIDQCKREGWLQKIKDEEGEGCNVYGSLEVNKVAGNFHFAPGKSFQQSNMHVHDLLVFQKESFNVSHKINELSFGPHFPGVVNPLDGAQRIQMTPTGMYQYFIKVVPTVYRDIRGHNIQTNQFSVTEHFRPVEVGMTRALPGVFFFYDLSPIKVNFDQTKTSFLHFVTNVCAIVGGVFTVSGIIDAFVYHGHRAIKKKMEIGKFS